MRWAISMIALWFAGSVWADPPYYSHIDEPPHLYKQRPLQDPFTRLRAAADRGEVQFDSANEKAFLKSLLRALQVPIESQILVFSTTSLQLSLISPRNPRALYFNEEVYIGFIPGGKVEVISLDPDLGGIFYIFPVPRAGEKLQAERSDRCMNCHSGAPSRYMPGLVLESVVPAPSGGSLDAFRKEETGHQIPFDQRFGGYYVTGEGAITNHWGNLIGRMHEGEISRERVEPGQRFDWGKYLVPSSDLLAHLLLEHQAGFVNRTLEATYRTRTLLQRNGGSLSANESEELDDQARNLVRYILFADEPPLPAGGVPGDARLKQAFLANKRVASNQRSLKDLDLREHLFQNRCSYMVYSPLFAGLPAEIKSRVFRELNVALDESSSSHLAPQEKRIIHTILAATLPGWPQ